MNYQYANDLSQKSKLRQLISQHYACSEQEAVQRLLATLSFDEQQQHRIDNVARELIMKVRAKNRNITALMP